ncbi:MAG: iron-sulfur cluster-binding domain-containing protein, partial [Natronospirillum sp.]
DYQNRRIFCCGPTPYMKAVRDLLLANGFDMDRYHEESFNSTPTEATQDALEQAEIAVKEADEVCESELFAVAFAGSGKSIQALPGETVHSAAARLGLTIPKACGVGICGTCKVQKNTGEVAMQHNGGITEEDVAEGYILSCCSVPLTDVTVEL